MPKLESLTLKPHIFIASGADVITRFIIGYEITPHSAAAMNRGCRAICNSGRPPCRSAARGFGACTPDRTIIATTATTACAAKLQANRYGGQISMVHCTNCGPSTPANTPPAITQDTALGRYAAL